jgi:SAM-dependent methyltransferase
MAYRVELSFRSRLARHSHVGWTATVPDAPSWPQIDPKLIRILPRSAFNEKIIALYRGRFYPSKLLSVADTPARIFRVLEVSAEDLAADFNAPLAYFEPVLRHEPVDTPVPAIGNPDALLRFAGMEAPPPRGDTDFSDPDGFDRADSGNDREFYARPRRVAHVDAVCGARIAALYTRLIDAGYRVLDLMSGWRSHLPDDLGAVSGLGLNEEEMADNPALDSYCTHDLNADPHLPYDDGSFDAVVNTVSIEYLVEPLAVLREMRRVLRPDGVAIISFSNRYFPPKAIRLWTRMLPMERLGLVLQWMSAAGFVDLAVHSERGLERDPRDRYTEQLREMDPLFAVWGHAP